MLSREHFRHIVVWTTLRYQGLTGTLGVLHEIRRLPDALHRLTSTIQALADLQRETGPGEARLEELERSRAMWEAEIGALIVKAESSFKAARNAEERARGMAKAYEKLDPFREEVEEVETLLRQPDAPRSEEEGLLPVHLDLAPNNKAYALRSKWGLG